MNRTLLMGSRCNIKNLGEFEFPRTTHTTIVHLQYCKIILLMLSKERHYSQVAISNSVIDTDGMQSPYYTSISTESLDLSHNRITKHALKVLISIISNSPALLKLYLIDNLIQARMTEDSGMIKNVLSFKELDLYNKSIPEEIAIDLAAALGSKSYLQTLWLNECYLATSVALVVKVLTNISRLRELNLNGSISGSEFLSLKIANLLTKSKSLQKFYLNETDLKVSGTIKITKSLRNISDMKLLDFQNNAITEEAAGEIASVISKNSTMEELYLGGNHLQEGVIKISKALRKIASLKVLDLENNKMSGKVAEELASAISANNSLKKLWLDNNNNLGSSITKIVMACCKNSNLEQLCIVNTGISEKVAKDIADIFISNNFTIIYLSLSDNDMQSSGFTSICCALLNAPILNNASSDRRTKPLKFLHACGINITAKVTKEVKKLIENNVQLEEISLGDNLLKSDLIHIVNACSKLKFLQVLDISHNCVSPQSVKNLASSLDKCYSLESLSLGGICLSVSENICLNVRALQDKMCNFKETDCILASEQQSYNTIIGFTCYELLKMKTIRDLMLNYEWIHLSYIYECVYISHQIENMLDDIIGNKINCMLIAQKVKQNLTQIDSKTMLSLLEITEQLRALNLENNNIDEDSATELASHLHYNNILEQLWLRGNGLCDKGASVVLQSLCNLSTLLILDLSFNHLTSESANAIADVIGNNRSLQQLWLDGNNLLNGGVVIIARALKKLSSLRILSLCSNGITNDAAEEISDVITCNVSLVDLLLGNNQLQAMGICKIAVALRKLLMLRKLDLFNNQVTPDAAEELADALSNCTNLQQLFLSDNMLGTEGTITIANALKSISRLHVLTLSNNNITESAAYALADVLRNNISLKILLIGGNNMHKTGINLIVQAAKIITALQLLDVSHNGVSEDEKETYKRIYANNNNFKIVV